MIEQLTGGDVCFGQPANTVGIFIAVICAICIWEVFWLLMGKRE